MITVKDLRRERGGNGGDRVAGRGRRRGHSRRRHRGDGGLHPPDPVRGRARGHPAGPPRSDPDPDDAGPHLRPADRRGLRAQAGLLLGRQPRASARCTGSATRSSTAGRSRSSSRSTATPAWPTGTSPARPGCRSPSCAATAAPTWPAQTRPPSPPITCPFTGETLTAVAALTPDVAVIHAQRADRAGQRPAVGHHRRAEGGGARRGAVGGHRRGDRRRARPAAGRGRAAVLGGQLRGRGARAARTRPTRSATPTATTTSTWPGTRSAGTGTRFRRWLETDVSPGRTAPGPLSEAIGDMTRLAPR